MSKKIMLAVVVILILSLIAVLGILSGCKGQATEESLGSPVELVDGEENIVELAAPADKIIVLAPSALEIINGLGAMELVVEVDNFSVMMAEPLAEGFEGAGDSYGLNIEKIAELNPDILITTTGGPDDDYQI